MENSACEHQIEKAAHTFLKIVKSSEFIWEECYFRLSVSCEGVVNSTSTYLKNSIIEYIDDDHVWENEDILKKYLLEIFDTFEKNCGARPKVGVLKITQGGDYNFKMDYDDSNKLDITFHSIGLKNSYFAIGEVEAPEFMRAELKEKARWEKMLAGARAVELRFRVPDFGSPGPEKIDDVEDAIADSITKEGLGKITRSRWESDESGQEFEVLEIGLANYEVGLEKLEVLLKKINAPNSVSITEI